MMTILEFLQTVLALGIVLGVAVSLLVSAFYE